MTPIPIFFECGDRPVKEDDYADYDKDENGKPLSCCGDVLEEESGYRCKTCGENC